jgi:hypothetical protein
LAFVLSLVKCEWTNEGRLGEMLGFIVENLGRSGDFKAAAATPVVETISISEIIHFQSSQIDHTL